MKNNHKTVRRRQQNNASKNARIKSTGGISPAIYLCSLYQALTLGVCMSAALCLTQEERVISKTVVPPALTQ